MTSYFDVSDAEGLDLGDSDNAQDERAEALAWFASLEAAGAPSTCDHCGVPERFNVLCPDCEELCCTSCGRVECCCEITAADGGEYPCEMCGHLFSANQVWEGLCTACRRFDAAHSGEENDDMMDPDKMMEPRHSEDPAFDVQLRVLLEGASNLQLKQVRYSLEREEKKRLEDAQATIRALDPNAPKPRARRSDAGRPRQKPANEVARDEKGVAV